MPDYFVKSANKPFDHLHLSREGDAVKIDGKSLDMIEAMRFLTDLVETVSAAVHHRSAVAVKVAEDAQLRIHHAHSLVFTAGDGADAGLARHS